MKKVLLAALVLITWCTGSLAQSKYENELRDRFWDSKDPARNSIEIPEKWADESAVILYLEENYTYTNNGKKMYNPSYFHERVKLLDKAAIEAFSEFTYNKDQHVGAVFVNFYREQTTVGIKIIKPSGEEIILDAEAATVQQDNENKLAIPGLEVGDILDIFIYEDDYNRSFSGTHYYDPVEKILSLEYPIVKRRLEVEVENDYFLNMESYNNAPTIKEEPTDKRATRRYVLEMSDIEKVKFPRWFYPLVELPCVKFQVTFALKSKNENHAAVFLAEDDAERKAAVSNEEILEYYGDRFSTDSRRDVKDVLRYLEDNNITDKRQQLVEGLYYIRHMSYNRFIELLMARDGDISYYPEPCDSDYVILDENRFVSYMAGLAKQLELDYDIIVATPSFNGSIDDLLLRSNVMWGLRINFAEPVYLFELSPHVQPDLFPYVLEGTKVYNLSVKKNRKLEEVSFDVLPTTTAATNISSETVNVNFSEDFKNINVTRDLKFQGHFKTEGLARYVFFGDFLNEEFEHYDSKHFFDCRKRQSRKDEEIENKMNALYQSYREQQEERLEELFSDVFEVTVEDYDSKVVASERYSNKPLMISDEFTITDEFVKKAGSNYIVEVGKFIGGQVHVTEDEVERNSGVYIDYAKTFSYEVAIAIPEGYEVVGLEKLEHDISNNTGSFKSTATIKDGKLHYSTQKTYAKKSYKASDWPAMLEWLEAAYDFSQEKVLFKKV
ncbi:DUF3857 domain-containing protein [Luteirhabdus pelagi]|uniref:DUF3857 domain-containing protein n=1 Tax=Luteirhabdus pelagi TaxID=2792783 RepID=UPI00193A7FAF|nr:DUF3857 domain-containing protein [Luteirhabdus pelagi]